MNLEKFSSSVSKDEYLYISNEGLKKLIEVWDPKNPQKNFNWTTDYTLELPIRMKKSGPGSEPAFTLIEAFQNVVKKIPKNPAMRVKKNKKWVTWTYSKYYEDACIFAKALISCGITPYASVNIIGFNAPEWLITFFGSIFAGYLPVGIYTNNNPSACKYVASHSEAEVVVVENCMQLNKFLQVWSDLPKLKYIIVYNDVLPKDLPVEMRSKVLTFDQFLEIGRKRSSNDEENTLVTRMGKQKPGNCCTLVYTSGTTGNPKAVMISHDNYTYTSTYIIKNVLNFEFGRERVITYLPLSHVAGQIMDIVSGLLAGAEITFAEPTALNGTLFDTILETRPTFFFGVPRVWEKVASKMESIFAKKGTINQILERWAEPISIKGSLSEIQGRPLPLSFLLARKLVYKSIKKSIGFDQTRNFMFGAAPMASQTRQYFLSHNIFLKNSYGMSESSGPIAFTNTKLVKPESNYLLSAGKEIEGTDMILHDLDEEGNGELCFKGRYRFMGYFKNEAETRNTIDENGFIHSGDIGKFDELGNIYITGRIKELIITSGGENIPPVLIENKIKEEIPFLSNAMVVGEKKNFLVALLTFKLELNEMGVHSDKLSVEAIKILRAMGCNAKTFSEASKDDKIIKIVDDRINKVNEKAVSRSHNIRKWAFVSGDFTVEGGELTPTLKLRRKVAESKYQDVISKLYLMPKL